MTPIQYVWPVEPHFSHFDMYGHVNTQYLIDYVLHSRHSYFKHRWNLTGHNIVADGFSIVTVRLNFNFRKAIADFSTLTVSSHVERAIGPMLKIPFRVTRGDHNELVMDGMLEQVVLDIKTGQAFEKVPDQVLAYFYEETNARSEFGLD
jgi:acyl-CoA thioesterase FadM